MTFIPNDSYLSSNQDINRFLVYVELNPRFLIQPLKNLPVKLTGSYNLA